MSFGCLGSDFSDPFFEPLGIARLFEIPQLERVSITNMGLGRESGHWLSLPQCLPFIGFLHETQHANIWCALPIRFSNVTCATWLLHGPKDAWAARRAASSLHSMYMYELCICIGTFRALLPLIGMDCTIRVISGMSEQIKMGIAVFLQPRIVLSGHHFVFFCILNVLG